MPSSELMSESIKTQEVIKPDMKQKGPVKEDLRVYVTVNTTILSNVSNITEFVQKIYKDMVGIFTEILQLKSSSRIDDKKSRKRYSKCSVTFELCILKKMMFEQDIDIIRTLLIDSIKDGTLNNRIEDINNVLSVKDITYSDIKTEDLIDSDIRSRRFIVQYNKSLPNASRYESYESELIQILSEMISSASDGFEEDRISIEKISRIITNQNKENTLVQVLVKDKWMTDKSSFDIVDLVMEKKSILSIPDKCVILENIPSVIYNITDIFTEPISESEIADMDDDEIDKLYNVKITIVEYYPEDIRRGVITNDTPLVEKCNDELNKDLFQLLS